MFYSMCLHNRKTIEYWPPEKQQQPNPVVLKLALRLPKGGGHQYV
jgi:hypothetical protein